MYPYETVYYYSDKDALTYFEWLISVVSGTQEGVVSQETFTKAVNQLFLFIFGLTGTLTSKVDLLEPYSLDEHLTELKERIFRVDTKVDHMNEKIVGTLEKIRQWQKMYEPYLDELKKERDERDSIGKSLKGASGNGKQKNP